MRGNPQLSAIALLVRKFGDKIEGGGYEVFVSAAEMVGMGSDGMFQEVPDMEKRGVRWRYYPQPTIEGELITPKSVTPEGVEPEKLPEVGSKE